MKLTRQSHMSCSQRSDEPSPKKAGAIWCFNAASIVAISGLASLLLFTGVSYGADNLKKNIKVQTQTGQAAAVSQKKVDQLASQTDEMLQEYGAVLSRIDTTRVYNEQIKRLISSQEKEMITVKNQIESIENTHQAVVPLMIRMVAAIGKFVELDLPFLPKERSSRIAELKRLMNRADVTTSEKYRRVMEAYQVENDYGRTIEAYRDTIELNKSTLTVDFLRVGRVLLAYQSIDGKKSGVWDVATQGWKELSDNYRKALRDGLRIARKQAAPDLIALPINAPELVDGPSTASKNGGTTR